MLAGLNCELRLKYNPFLWYRQIDHFFTASCRVSRDICFASSCQSVLSHQIMSYHRSISSPPTKPTLLSSPPLKRTNFWYSSTDIAQAFLAMLFLLCLAGTAKAWFTWDNDLTMTVFCCLEQVVCVKLLCSLYSFLSTLYEVCQLKWCSKFSVCMPNHYAVFMKSLWTWFQFLRRFYEPPACLQNCYAVVVKSSWTWFQILSSWYGLCMRFFQSRFWDHPRRST